MLNLALRYIETGVEIFPCDPETKKPLTKHGFKSATTDKSAVRRWWRDNPNALIGAVCGEKMTVVDVDLKNGFDAFESLSKIHQFTTQSAHSVSTKSNGAHYYFSGDPEIRRRLKVLPHVDILGTGGYVILPDDNVYRQTGAIERFISDLSNDKLVGFPSDFKGHLTKESVIESLLVEKPVESKPSKPASESEVFEDEEEKKLRQMIEEKERLDSERVYQKNNEKHEYEEIHFDGTPIKIGLGELTTAKMNGLFHNRAVQSRMAAFMGVQIPTNSSKRTSAFRSMIPGHSDSNPSMACRWVGEKDRAHLVVRDFSDYYNNNKVDYNLVRLYACQHYKTHMAHMGSTLFSVWFLRLLDDSGVIEINTPEFKGQTYKMTPSERRVADGFLKLLGYKLLREGTNGETLFTQKFAAAWCGVSQSVVNTTKSKLIKFGNIIKSGKFFGTGRMRSEIFALGACLVLKSEIFSFQELQFALRAQLKKKVDAGLGILGRARKKNEAVNKEHTEEASRVDNYERRRKKEQPTPVPGLHYVWDGD